MTKADVRRVGVIVLGSVVAAVAVGHLRKWWPAAFGDRQAGNGASQAGSGTEWM